LTHAHFDRVDKPLAFAAVAEAATGLALFAPALVGRLPLGMDSPASPPTLRVLLASR
jgi:hypothetical protein